jgi:uncharacterized LabA/DUF88 family protein
MKTSDPGDHLAILIDADNVSPKVIAGVMAEVAKYGTASVRRIYGDWTSPYMKSWREHLLGHSIVPIQQFAYTTGKNATDGAMIIDAMDLLYTNRFASFCLVSSDSDFTRLAARIREQGIAVYGFGNRNKTHRAFVAACNEFVYFDALPMQPEPEASTTSSLVPPASPKPHALLSSNNFTTQAQSPPPNLRPQPSSSGTNPRPLDQAALDALRKAIRSSNIYEDDYANLAEVGAYLVKISPDLNAPNYGYPRLRDFVLASGIVQLKMKTFDGRPPIALVRLKE